MNLIHQNKLPTHKTQMKTIRLSYSPASRLAGRALAARCAGEFGLLLLSCFLSVGLTAAESKRVTLVRTPNGGIQPQAGVDSQGVVHLIYYKGDAGGGDVFYVRQEPGQDTFSKPLPVNSQPGSAIAVGTIRGAQLAIGKKDARTWRGTVARVQGPSPLMARR